MLGADRVIGGAAYIATVIASPGVIKHTSAFAMMRFGRADKKPDATLNAFVEAGKAAKLDIALSPDIQRELWQKFIFLTAMAGSTATLRSSIGPIVADPSCVDFFRALMEEAFAVGKAKGVALDPAYLDDRMDFVVNKVEPGMKASMAHDLERGNRLELDWLAGKVRALGTRTPHSDAGERHGLHRAQIASHGSALTRIKRSRRARRFVAAFHEKWPQLRRTS